MNFIGISEPEDDFQIRRDLVQKISNLGKEYYQNPQASLVFTAILIHPDGITQDELMSLTALPRTTISGALTTLRTLGFISVVKHSNLRKKVYLSSLDQNDAFRRYLQHLLQNFEETGGFPQIILDQLQTLPSSAQKTPTIIHFIEYLLHFQKSNAFVISYFKQYLSRSFTPPHVPDKARNQIIQRMQKSLVDILHKFPQETDLKNPARNEDPNITLRLDEIKRDYFRRFMNLMEKTEKTPLYSVLVNLLYIEADAPTQDRIKNLINAPRSTLSDALRRVENDHLIKSLRFRQDRKIHYFPSIPRQLLLPFKLFSQLRSLVTLLDGLRQKYQKIAPNSRGQADSAKKQGIRNFVQVAMKEYDRMIDFLLFLERQLAEEFQLTEFI